MAGLLPMSYPKVTLLVAHHRDRAAQLADRRANLSDQEVSAALQASVSRALAGKDRYFNVFGCLSSDVFVFVTILPKYI